MISFRKLSHTVWHCQYLIVWVPKYRYRILDGSLREPSEMGIKAICGYAGCEVMELNVQRDHVHLMVMIPPKVSISRSMGCLKGQTLMKLFNEFRKLGEKPYWGIIFGRRAIVWIRWGWIRQQIRFDHVGKLVSPF